MSLVHTLWCSLKRMEQKIRNVLAVGVAPSFYRRFEPLLRREHFDVDRISEGDCALALIQSVAIDVLLIGHSISNPSVVEFLAEVRKKGCPCRRSAVLIVAPEPLWQDAETQFTNGHTRVVAVDASDQELADQVSSLLRMAPRLSVRVTIRLEALLEDGSVSLMTQTENVSSGGMLVRMNRPYGVEFRLRFEILLPEGHSSVTGTGEIVRHTVDRQGRSNGAGIRFIGFDYEGEERLKAFLASRRP